MVAPAAPDDPKPPERPADADAEPLLLDFLAAMYEGQLGGAEVLPGQQLDRYGVHADWLLQHWQRLRRGKADGRRRIGPYVLVREIARGGQAVVHEAEDERLRRRIALKVMRPDPAHLTAALARFAREAELAARLEDPGLCPIHATGIDDGNLWIAMRLLPGGTLRERIAAWRRAGPGDAAGTRATVAMIAGLLRTLARLHGIGVVHRDLKPGNIAFDEHDRAVVLDLGLAAAVHDEAELTADTSAGTPAYMAPEQLAGGRADERTDLHAVGVILWEALARRHPFAEHEPGAATTRERLHRAILSAEPEPLVRLRVPQADCDLDAVLAMAVAKQPDRRYATAAAFADDLERWLGGRPVLARHVGIAGRAWRWARREPKLALASAATFLLLLAGLAVTSLLSLRLADERAATDDALRLARAAGLRTEAQRVQPSEPRLALRLALAAHVLDPGAATRSVLWTTWARLPVIDVLPASAPLTEARMSADRNHVLSMHADGSARVWHLVDGSVTQLPVGRDACTAGVLSGDGRCLALAHGRHVMLAGGGGWQAVAFDQDVLDLDADDALGWAAGLADGRVFVADGAAREPELLVTVAGPVAGVALLADGCVAVHTLQHEVALFDAAGERLLAWTAPSHARPQLCLSADRTRLIAAEQLVDGGNGIRVVDRRNGTVRTLWGGLRLEWLDVAPEGDRVAASTGMGTVVSFDLERGTAHMVAAVGRTFLVAHGHCGRIVGLELDGSLWLRLPDSRTRRQQLGEPWPHWLSVSADGRPVTLHADGSGCHWRMHSAAEVAFEPPPGSHSRLAQATDGTLAMTLASELQIRGDGQPPVRVPLPDAVACTGLQWSPDGSHLLLVDPGGGVHVHDRLGGRRWQRPGAAPNQVAAFVADHDVAVLGADDVEIVGADGTTMARLPTVPPRPRALSVARDGRLLAVAGELGDVVIAATDGRVAACLTVVPPVQAMALADDGTLALVDGNRRLNLFARDGAAVANAPLHAGFCRSLLWSNDAMTLLSASFDGTAARIDRGGRVQAWYRPGAGPLLAAVFVPQRGMVATLAQNGQVSVFAADGEPFVAIGATGAAPAAGLAVAADGGSLWLDRLGHAFARIPLDEAELLQRAKAAAGGPLGDAERRRYSQWLAPGGAR